MEELNLIGSLEEQSLLKAVEEHTGLLLPMDREYLGEINFHIYCYDQKESEKNDISYLFQIRWGMHKIFSKKHLCLQNKKDCTDELIRIIKQEKSQIKKELIEYIESQLGTFVTLELEPAFNQKFSALRLHEMKVDRGRNKHNSALAFGWPNLCIFISWYDEFGEFQEFVYPIRIDKDTRSFRIPTSTIITHFRRYRDSLI